MCVVLVLSCYETESELRQLTCLMRYDLCHETYLMQLWLIKDRL